MDDLGLELNRRQWKRALAQLDRKEEGTVNRQDFMAWYKEHGQGRRRVG